MRWTHQKLVGRVYSVMKYSKGFVTLQRPTVMFATNQATPIYCKLSHHRRLLRTSPGLCRSAPRGSTAGRLGRSPPRPDRTLKGKAGEVWRPKMSHSRSPRVHARKLSPTSASLLISGSRADALYVVVMTALTCSVAGGRRSVIVAICAPRHLVLLLNRQRRRAYIHRDFKGRRE